MFILYMCSDLVMNLNKLDETKLKKTTSMYK